MSQFVTMDIPQGRLRGKRVTSSSSGATYYSFQGIPYAKPPVGPLRFKPPEDPQPWTGTRDATVEGAIAPQMDFFSKKLVGDEDCLFLNVYTPQLAATSPKAVMVWFHGGGFMLRSGNSDMFGPDFIVAEDVVLVTLNYRLGALGFLYLEGTDITGNNGMRDQVMALKWVKKNIAHFGGDPDNMTIFGESAGGISVHLLMLSPLAEGLFHRAIAMSGTALISTAYTPCEVNNQRTIRLAKVLGCTSQDPQKVINFLRSVPVEKLVPHQMEELSEEEHNRILDIPFFPCEEVGPEPFLPAHPRTLIREGRFTKVPFITGAASAEGKVMLHELFLHMKLSELDEKFGNVLPLDLASNIDTERSKEISNIIKKFYFGERPVGEDTLLPYIDMMSDLSFVYPMYETLKSHIGWSPHPTYLYLFDHMLESGMDVLKNAKDNLPGVSHGGDMPFLFDGTYWKVSFPPGSVDAQVRHTFVQLWTQFAKTGIPSSTTVNVTWTPATEKKMNYLKIKNGLFSMETDMYKNRTEFLDELYSKYLPQTSK